MAEKGSQAGLAEAFLHPSVGRNARLEAISDQIDWSQVERALSGLRQGRMGPPSYPALLMFKALLLQQWYGLSDPAWKKPCATGCRFAALWGLRGTRGSRPRHAVALPPGSGSRGKRPGGLRGGGGPA